MLKVWISCQRFLHLPWCLLVRYLVSQNIHVTSHLFDLISPHFTSVQVFILSSSEDMKRYLETFEVWKAFERTFELKAFVVSLERTPNVRAWLLSDLLRHSRWAPCSPTPQRPSIRVLWCSRLRDTYVHHTYILTVSHNLSYSHFLLHV